MPSTVGRLQFDLDPAAERLLVFDRNDGQFYFFGKVSPTLSVIVPQTFATSNRLCAILFDDGNTYDLTGTDKIQAELVTIAP